MKKQFLLTLALVIALSLAACGEESSDSTSSNDTTPSNVSLNDNASSTDSDLSSISAETVSLVDVTTELGIVLKLPGSLTKKETNFYSDEETGDSAAFTADLADPSYPLSDMTEQDFIDFQFSDRDNLEIISYENDLIINGNKALVCKFSFTSAEGNSVSGAVVFVNFNGAEYSVSLLYLSDNENSALANNIDACIESITITQ